MSKSAIGTSKTIYEIRSKLNAHRLTFRWCKVTEILKICLLCQICLINLAYKKNKNNLPIALIINKLKQVKKITLLWIFLWIRHKNSYQHQMSDHNVPSKKRIACPVFSQTIGRQRKWPPITAAIYPMYQENPWFEKLFCFQYRVMTRFPGQS